MPPPPYTAPQDIERRDWIAGLEKGLHLIEAFDAEHSRLTASQAAQRCGMTRTATRRYLLTLVHTGHVSTDGKLFWLTPRVMRLGQAYLESARLPRAVHPYLQRVTAGTGEIAYTAVLDHDELVYIARSGAQRHLNTGYMLGSRVQPHLTAAGMVILGMLGPGFWEPWLAAQTLRPFTSHTVLDKQQLRQQLMQVREQGWAISEQQLEMNYRGIAVPLWDHNDQLLGAMSVTMPMNNETSEVAVKRILPVLQDTARSARPML
jgi:IclR family pca regulon transcriptional regulator